MPLNISSSAKLSPFSKFPAYLDTTFGEDSKHSDKTPHSGKSKQPHRSACMYPFNRWRTNTGRNNKQILNGIQWPKHLPRSRFNSLLQTTHGTRDLNEDSWIQKHLLSFNVLLQTSITAIQQRTGLYFCWSQCTLHRCHYHQRSPLDLHQCLRIISSLNDKQLGMGYK